MTSSNNKNQQLSTATLQTGPSIDDMNQIVALYAAAEHPAMEMLSRKLTEAWPHHVFGWKALGVSLKMQKKDAEAMTAMRKAVALDPNDSDVHNNLASALREAGELEEAQRHFELAIKLKPAYPEALSGLGMILRAKGEVDKAIECYKLAVSFNPKFPEGYNNLGNAYREKQEYQEAMRYYSKAMECRPRYADALNGLGNVMVGMANYPTAIDYYRQAIDIQPDYPEAYNGLANALKASGNLKESEATYLKSIALKPAYHDPYHNLANLYKEQNQIDKAIEYYRKALAAKPDYFSAAAGLGMALLHKGDFHEGWQYYEKRWEGFEQAISGTLKRPVTSLPQWRGEQHSPDDAIIVFCEQGLGDSLQFVRYIPLLAKRFKQVTAIYPSLLINILNGSMHADNLEITDRIPTDHSRWQWHCSALSLPLAFDTQLESIPANVPYLKAPVNRIEYWQQKLTQVSSNDKPKIGLVWAGGNLLKDDSKRSIPPHMMLPLINNSAYTFVSLQKASVNTKKLTKQQAPDLLDWMDEIKDFADTAALIENLDLVISVDTSVAHLAGAMGKPVWLLNRQGGDWRWIIGRDDSPWYPSMHIFAQKIPGDWETVISQVSDALKKKFVEPTSKQPPQEPSSENPGSNNQSPGLIEMQHLLNLFSSGAIEEHENQCKLLTAKYPDQNKGFISSYCEVLNGFGLSLYKAKNLLEASRYLEYSVSLMPAQKDVLYLLGSIYYTQKNLTSAARKFRLTLSLDDTHYSAHMGLALSLLSNGDWEEGWKEYEYRSVGSDLGLIGKANKPASDLPEWQGQELSPEDSLIVFREQGYGDAIQFIRYAALAASRFKHVTIVTSSALVSLFRHSLSTLSNVEIIEKTPKNQKKWQWQCMMLSLPLAFKSTLENLPNHTPYLHAPENLIEKWGLRLQQLGTKKLKVGLTWACNPENTNLVNRSMPAENLNKLLQLDDITWVSLQKDQQENCPPGMVNWMNEIDDFIETAALIENLDLVISVDTSVVHLAGAMAKPVWLLNRHESDWRWMINREDSPWYPTMHIFTQSKPNDWGSVIADVILKLKDMLSSERNTLPTIHASSDLQDALQDLLGAFNLLPEADYRAKLSALIKEYRLLGKDIIPPYFNLLNTFGFQFYKQDSFAEAKRCFQETLRLVPDNVYAAHHLSIVLFDNEETDECINVLKKLMLIKQDRHDFSASVLGLALMAKGNFEEGWPLYERRWTVDENSISGKKQKPILAIPEWQGQEVHPEDSLLIYFEQGTGDQIQFIRYINQLAKRFKAITVCGNPALLDLLKYSFRHLKNVAFLPDFPADIGHYQWQIALVSIPLAINLKVADLDGKAYLQVPPEKLTFWQQRFASYVIQQSKKIKIGIAWAGGKHLGSDHRRSINPQLLLPLLKNTDCLWFSLQKADTAEKVADSSCAPYLIDWMDEVKDYADTAAIIQQLDIVISVDTSVAHLAGALGKPVWMLNRFGGDWRWRLKDHTTDWYNSMRIFKQSQHANWSNVLEEISRELINLSATSSAIAGSDVAKQSAQDLQKMLNAFTQEPREIYQTKVFNVVQKYQAVGINFIDLYTHFLNSFAYQFLQSRTLYESKKCFEEVVRIAPSDFYSNYHLGIVLANLNDVDEAINRLRSSIAIEPQPFAYYALALALLSRGDFEEGWSLFEYRWTGSDQSAQGKNKKSDLPVPHWAGEPVEANDSLLLYMEEGNGDRIQFIRFLPRLAKIFGSIYVFGDKNTQPLFAHAFAHLQNIKFIEEKNTQINSPKLWQCPIMSLGLALKLKLEDITGEAYLRVPPSYLDKWQTIFSKHFTQAETRLKVGITWTGSSGLGADKLRSLPYPDLDRLLARQDVVWVSLQKTDNDSKRPDQSTQSRLVDMMNDVTDFADTAAIIQQLDLVISVDTSVAHLAGALGKPVWMMNRHAGDWRWMIQKPDTRWYTSMRIYNQDVSGKWDSVIDKINADLNALIKPVIEKPAEIEVSAKEKTPSEGILSVDSISTAKKQYKTLSDDEKPILELIELFDTGDLAKLETLAKAMLVTSKLKKICHYLLGVAIRLQAKKTSTDIPLQLSTEDISLAPNLAGDLQIIKEAVAHFDSTPEAKNWYAFALHRLAATLILKGEMHAAIRYYQLTLKQLPSFIEAYTNLGTCYLKTGQFEQAIKCYKQSIKLKPDDTIAINGLAVTYKTKGEFETAIKLFKEALKQTPKNAELLNNLAATLLDMRKADEAIPLFRQSISADPTYEAAYMGLALSLLASGEWLEGWQHYEHRWGGSNFALQGKLNKIAAKSPQWKGETVAADATLLVFTEQGLGDNFQFIRYVKLAAAKFAKVAVLCPGMLLHIFKGSLSTLPNVLVTTEIVDSNNAWDYHCYMMSLPLAFGTTIENLPNHVPYLIPPLNRVNYWSTRLNYVAAGKPKVGLVWAGGAKLRDDSKRSIPIQQLLPLLQNDSVCWVSMQKSDRKNDISSPECAAYMQDWMDEINDFADTAALIETLDLVIAVDTSVAHLAGAMGKPVWLFNRYAGDWRWMINRTNSPWYPTMRIFNQSQADEWSDVIAEMATALEKWIIAKPHHLQTQTVQLAQGPSEHDIESTLAFFHQKDWAGLEASTRKLISQYPLHGFGYKSLGVALKMLKRDAEALPILKKAVDLLPSDAIVLNNYANALNQAGSFDEAKVFYEKALALTPDLAEAQDNLAIILINMTVNLSASDRLDEALELCNKVLTIKPDSAVAWFNKGVLLKDLNRNEEAIISYQNALKIDPAYIDAQYNISMSQLVLGQFEQGFVNYELRFKREIKKPLGPAPFPLWMGEHSISGKKLLIQSEQGFGDSIHMARYLNLLEKAGVTCHLQVSTSLVTLIRRSFPNSKVIDAAICPQELDFRIPLMSLPLALKTFSEKDIPSFPSYLIPDQDKVSFWAKELKSKSKKVGLVWRGSPTHVNDKNRSISVEHMLEYVKKNPKIQFVCLQKNLTSEDRKALQCFANIRILDNELKDFDDTAAVISNIDLVLTIDSSVAHLAAALGKPVWVMLAFRPDWRWMLNRDDSPWYPTMQLFRQKIRGDWAAVISNINKKLKKL